MPQQLIYTSAPRGIVAGRSGHCTVARSALMREALMLQLEKFCYYQHLSLSGGQERPIFSCRIVDIRGTRFHVLSRIQDAGLDFTGRTNFIAHHLVFTPEETRQYPTPPVILREWPGWVKSWTKEPQTLENEDWADLTALAGKSNIPAQTWQRVTGDAVNGYGLLETRAGASFRVDDQTDETVLELIAESLELLEVRDARRDFRTAAWNYTFTTSMQEQDNPADFRWRCIHSDNPAANRLATPDCRELSAVRVSRWTDKEKESEETAFARTGRQPPRFIEQPKNQRIREGEDAILTAKAEGVPTPKYQWFECDREEKESKKLEGETSSKLVLKNFKQGTTRYIVWATNGVGNDCRSDPAKLEVDPPKTIPTIQKQSTKTSIGVRTMTQKSQLDAWVEPEPAPSDSAKYTIPIWWLIAILIVVVALGGGAWWLIKHRSPKLEPGSNSDSARSGNGTSPPGPQSTPAPSSNPQASTQSPDGKAATSVPTPKTKRDSNSPPPTEFVLPDGWNQMNVGAALHVNAEYINVKPSPRFDMSAVATGFFTNGDGILFVCKTNTGNEFTATLLKIDSPTVQNRCGIMIRESQNSNSPFLFIGASMQKVFAYRRDEKGAFFSDGIDIPKGYEGSPVMLKIYPKDKLFALAYSFDGKDWPSFPNYSISNNTQTLVGFAISSGSSSESVTAHFVDLSPKSETAPKK